MNRNPELREEFEYFLEHHDELVGLYNGKFIAIKNKEVIGSYSTMQEALAETTKVHPLGTFIVQKCEPGSESYTLTFRSRVAFA